MISRDLAQVITRELGHLYCTRECYALDGCMYTEYGILLSEALNAMEQIGAWATATKQVVYYYVPLVDKTSASLYLEQPNSPHAFLGLEWTLTEDKVVLNVSTDGMWQVLRDMFEDLVIKLLDGDNIGGAVYDLAAIAPFMYELYLSDPVKERLVKRRDIFTEQCLVEMANAYVKWHPISVISGVLLSKLPVNLVLSRVTKMLLSCVPSNEDDFFLRNSLGGQMCILADGVKHILTPGTFYKLTNRDVKDSFVPCYWTKHRILNGVETPYAQFLYRPDINYTDYIAPVSPDRLMLVPSEERALLDMMTCEDYYDRSYIINHLHSYLKANMSDAVDNLHIVGGVLYPNRCNQSFLDSWLQEVNTK